MVLISSSNKTGMIFLKKKKNWNDISDLLRYEHELSQTHGPVGTYRWRSINTKFSSEEQVLLLKLGSLLAPSALTFFPDSVETFLLSFASPNFLSV